MQERDRQNHFYLLAYARAELRLLQGQALEKPVSRSCYPMAESHPIPPTKPPVTY